ncbi:hypothetical protein PS723_04303 [Pseudomonas fluorescens]|uniref:Uncharacterized protein n=1 Tax=Pseudomonas fluorescens TaxID=294 RepID=A0A5E7E673_PSEFL|nr:hypothetical protein PS723_04303 [Pseudomonas fluorescens]
MLPRYVVVPAIPTGTGSVRCGKRSSWTAAVSFSIYDNRDKQRLQPTYPTKAEAQAECERRNAVQLLTSVGWSNCPISE